MNDLNYYWINLDKAKDRRIFMENQFKKIGVVNNHRISAYTPDDLSSILIDNPPYNCGYPECIQNGCKNCPIEFAVLCSHMKAIQEGYKSNAPYFIVCEDDIGFPFEIDFNKMISVIPDEIDIIQMMVITEGHTNHFYYEFYKKGHLFIRYSPITPSAAFYLISRNGAKKLLYKYLDPNTNKFNFQNCNFLKLADVLIFQSVNTIVSTMPFVIPNIDFDSQIHQNYYDTIIKPAYFKIIEVIKDDNASNPFIKKVNYPLDDVEKLFKS